MATVLAADERQCVEQAEQDWFLTPCFLLRTGGLPFEALTRLTFEKTKAIVDQILDLDRQFDGESEALCETIFNAVKQVNDQSLKHRLIELKRNVFNRRHISEESVERLKQLLSEECYSKVDEWRRRQELLAHLLEEGERCFQLELDEKRTLLKAQFADEDFQKAVVLSSDALVGPLEQYLQTPVREMKRPHLKAESSLISYLSRMAAKTSPFSTFTPTTLGFWTKTGAALEFSQESLHQKSFVRFNQSLRVRIENALSRHPAIKRHLRPRVNKSWRLRGEKICLLKSSNAVLFGGDAPEPLVELPLTRAVSEFLSLLEAGEERLSYEELVNQMVERTGGARTVGEVEGFLDRLIQLEVIENDFRIPDQAPDFLGLLCEKLRAIPDPFAIEMLTFLDLISREVDCYPRLTAQERACSLRTLRHTTRQLFDALKLILEDHPIIIYEDAATYPRRSELSLSAWDGVLKDLQFVQRLNRISDYTVTQVMTLAAYFEQHHWDEQGEVDLLPFYDAYRQTIKAAAGARDSSPWDNLINLNPLNLPTVSAFQEVQQEYRRLLAQMLESGEEVVHLDRKKLEELMDRTPEFAREMSSQSYFCQLIISPDGNELVINAPYEGLGKYFSRFCFLFDDADNQTNTLADTIQQNQERFRGSGQVYAELVSVLGSNVNLHPPLTDFEIRYPGVAGSKPPEMQIELFDLSVRKEPKTGILKLWSRSLQKEVVPMYFGITHAWFLPPLHQFLYCMFSPVGTMNSMPGLEAGISKYEHGHEFRRYPRVCVGNAVLWRAEWQLPAATLPIKQNQESAFGYFLRVNRWKRQMGLPDEGFIRANSFFEILERLSETGKQASVASPAPAQQAQTLHNQKQNPIRMRDTSRKPQYINLGNYFLLSIFSKLASMVKRSLIFQEMLPSSTDLILQNERGHYVSEFLIELNYKGETLNENLA